ncbi:formin-like protein 18 isoform X2 [Manihot esculenta]|uniref:Uncharacterized protein n=1 Tax=Manihot esculenta TaxID=3983 RepID=A0ACB7G7Y9_MANES|nr:formin-like protein 18 isoform X2 [Manihot esculenta]KAG8636403.1 hypothetical protein MANES_16G129100v8 [Manihot esculenta]
MALFRKFFYRKPPDGLLEISERVYVFDSCFTTDVLEDDEYKVYIGNVVSQLRDYFPDSSFMVFNFREGEKQSQIGSLLSDYDMTVMDYPHHYEGCPLLTMEMIHHFLRSSESWLSLLQQNVLLMNCEQGGWPVLAFMLAALLIYRKQFTGEQKTLDMIYKQAPREFLQLMSPLNPLPSQLRYLQYISRRNVGSQWPPLDRALTLDCVILRVIPNMDEEGGCRPIFRIYGQDPLMVADRTPKVLFSRPKRSKLVRHYKQEVCDLIKIDIHCHIQGDIVMECISVDSDLEREQMMFRVMFNTAFIRSNILMLNRDEIDTPWNLKDQFPKDFRAEVLFSEMDSASSRASIDLPGLEEKGGLPEEAFAKVQEIFCNVDWLDTKPDVALNVLQHITTIQENLEAVSPRKAEKGSMVFEKVQDEMKLNEEKKCGSTTSTSMWELPLNSNSIMEKIEPQEPKIALQWAKQSKILSPRLSKASRSSPYQSTPSTLGISAVLHDHAASNDEEAMRSLTLTSSTISSPLPNVQKSVQLSRVSHIRLSSPPPPSSSTSMQCSIEGATSLEKISAAKCPLQSTSKATKSSPQCSYPSAYESSSFTPPPPPPPPPCSVESPSPRERKLFSASAPSPSPPPPPPLFSSGTSSSTIKNSHSALPSPPHSLVASSGLPPPPPAPSPGSVTGHSGVAKVPPPPPPPSSAQNSSNNLGPSSVDKVPPPPPPPSSAQNSSNSSACAPPVPPPPAPCAKGLSSSPATSSPSPAAPPVPGPPSGARFGSPAAPPVPGPAAPPVPGPAAPPVPGPPGAKGRGLLRSSQRIQGQPRRANLKPYHWLKLTRAMQGSLWAETQKSDEASMAPEIDMLELERLFSAAAPASQGGGKSNRRTLGAKPDKVQLIELRRAYNCEIMLSKVKIPLADLMSSLLALDDSTLDVDQVDNLIKFCPTKEEMELLKFFLELMKVPRVESKLRVFSFKLQFDHQVSDLRRNLNIVNSAAEEIRSSVKLKRILQTILSLGNALNQGTARGSAVGFRLDSLLKLTDTRAQNNKMTLMHYLCKVLADKLPEPLDFPKDLMSLEAVTKIQLKYLAEEMQAVSKGLEKVVQELSASENDGHVSEQFCKILKSFLSSAESEVRSLASLYSTVGRNADALALYFGEDPARCPFEQVVSTLLNFVRMFSRSHEENIKQIEIEKKKADKEAESERLKMNASKKESENLPSPTRTGNIK